MKRALTLLFLTAAAVFGQPTVPPPRPATQAEVDAGTSTSKFVTPATLAGSAIVGGGITLAQATNVVAQNNAASATTATNAAGPIYIIRSGGNTLGGFVNLIAAKTAAAAGDTIVVGPGTYNTNNLLKAYVNWHFEPGAKIWYAPSDANPWGIFDDRTVSGGYTGKITGKLDFLWEHSTNNVAADAGGAAVFITNANTVINLEMNDATGNSYATSVGADAGYPGIFIINNCRSARVKLNRLTTPTYATNDSFGNPPLICGFIWRFGETYFESDYVGIFPQYAIWPDNNDTDNVTTQNLWVKGQLCEGYIYSSAAPVSANATNYRCWYQFQEVKGSLYGAQPTAFGLFGGRHYIVAEKISSVRDPVIVNSENAQIWVTAQKLTASQNCKAFVRNNQGAGNPHIGKTILNVQEYEWLSTNKTEAGFVNDVGCQLILNGGFLTNMTAIGLTHAGGYTVLNGVTLATTISTNPPILVSGAGLTLNETKLFAPANTNSIYAAAAQTIGVYGSAANLAAHANVTVSPKAGWTVNGVTAFDAVTGDGSGLTALNASSISSGTLAAARLPEDYFEFALSDETTAITTGTAKLTWRAPFAFTVTGVRSSLTTVSSSGLPTVNIKEAGATIFSTKLTIDASEKTSTTAATPAVVSDSSIASDAEITFDIDVAGTGATGLKVKIFYTR